MVSNLPLFLRSSSPSTNPFVTVSRAQLTMVSPSFSYSTVSFFFIFQCFSLLYSGFFHFHIPVLFISYSRVFFSLSYSSFFRFHSPVFFTFIFQFFHFHVPHFSIVVAVVIIIIIIIIYSLEFLTSMLADGLSLEVELQQVSSSLQDSSQYSGRSQ